MRNKMKKNNEIYTISGKSLRYFLDFLLACGRQLSPSGRAGGGLAIFLYIATSFPPLGGSKAACQTTVCSGDAVVLTLKKEYKGTIQWQQSPDLSTWSLVSGSGATAANDTLYLNATSAFYYRAEVTDGSCLPFYSDTVLVTTVNSPAIPLANSASGISTGSFSAKWNVSSDATTYFLDVANDSGFTSFVTGYNSRNVGNITADSVKGLNCNKTYYYRVRASNACDTSINSNTVSVTTLNATPTAPAANAASEVTSGSFSANWAISPNATTYYLDVATDAGFTSFVAPYNNINMGNVNTYNITGLACNTNYYYRIRASNACGTSGNSSAVNVTTSADMPGAPTANAASGIKQTSFDANWTHSANATTYYLDLATNSGFTSFVAGYNNLEVGNDTTYNITGLTCNTPYYYRVRAGNTCGTSNNSNSISSTTASLIAPVANAATAIGVSTFYANWSASAEATAYFLDVATDIGFLSFVNGYNNLNVGINTTYKVSGLSCNTTYYYRVRANNSCGTTSNSDSVTVAVNCPAAPYCTLTSTCNGNITDSRDNKTYATIQIVNQCWMAENLNAGTYINGSTRQTNGPDNKNTSIEKYCYSNDTTNCNIYGGLYQWSEMMAYEQSVNTNGPGPRGICPTGWHIPTDNEWKCLEMNLGMSQLKADQTIGSERGADESGKLKQKGTSLWQSPNTGATNSSGFTALPGGTLNSHDVNFYFVNDRGTWWPSTSNPDVQARSLFHNMATISRGMQPKTSGNSVRCVKD